MFVRQNFLVRSLLFAIGSILLSTALLFSVQKAEASPVPQATANTDGYIPPEALMLPKELVPLLQDPAKKPVILQVGSHVLFAEAHIPGSEYVGPASQPAGLKLLQERVSTLPQDRVIVIYCGCCPWQKCPNIRPAYQKLKEMGFTHVKALYIADNFGTDWVNKGYPVAKGR